MYLIRNYPWKERLVPLMGASFLLWLALRPAYWPFLSTGDPDSAFFLNLLNRLVWAVIVMSSTGVVDFVAVQTIKYRKSNAGEPSKIGSLPHVFWSGLFATLLAKAVVDFTFADRPFPAGGEHWRGIERITDVVALAVLPVVFVVARRLGAPSNWPIVKSLILKPPTAQEQLRSDRQSVS